jgi:hypothetical protein
VAHWKIMPQNCPKEKERKKTATLFRKACPGIGI